MKKAYFLFLLMSLPLMVKAYDAKIDGIYYILNSSKKTAIVTSMDTWGANQTAYCSVLNKLTKFEFNL